jgi:hypothetical protein
MQSNHLPSILIPAPPNSSISLERALKQIKQLLEEAPIEGPSHEDRLNASIDDCDVMLSCIKRED